MQARQLPTGMRQRMEDDRHGGSVWPADESNQFLRTHAGAQRAHSSGFSPLEFYQKQQRPSHEEQLSQLDRNLSLQDRLQQGFYEPGSHPFERSMSLPAGAQGMNLDAVNAMARAQGLDMQDSLGRMPSGGQLGTFSSGIHSHNPHHPLPNQFHASHLDAIEGHWPEKNEQLENDWMDSRFQQLHINAERQKRESEINIPSQDRGLWMSDGLNEEHSKRLLMELLHKKSAHQPAESLNVNNGIFSDKRPSSGMYSGSSSSSHPFSLHSDQEAGLNNSFRVGSYGSNHMELPQEERASSMESNEKLVYRSDSGALVERESFLAGINATSQPIYTNSNIISKSSISKEVSELEGRKRGTKSEGIIRGQAFDTREQMVEQAVLAAPDYEERSANSLNMRSSSGVSGFHSDKIGRSNSFAEETTRDRVPAPSKTQDNILLRRPPVSSASASHEGLSELISNPVFRGQSASAAPDGGRQDPVVVHPVNQGSDALPSSSKKEIQFRRTSSASDADVSEASFMDMLKSNTKKLAPTDAHATAGEDAMQGNRSGKKKGKKGRQIDPALLGFKVTSNRIMMGEIHRIDD
ncbi:hypothetical protein ACFXTO_021816 [Malus domestica]